MYLQEVERVIMGLLDKNKTNLNTAIYDGDIPALVEFAKQGEAAACRSLYKHYREGSKVEANVAVAIVYGIFYVIFSGSKGLDENLAKEISEYILAADIEERSKALKWVESAKFDEKSEVFRIFLEPKKMYEIANKATKYSDKRDYQTALFYYEKALEGGYNPAKTEIAQLYFFGIFNEKREKDPVMAEYFLDRAKEGDAVAYRFLFECFLNGIGVNKDKNKALIFLLLANGYNSGSEVFTLLDKGDAYKVFEHIEKDSFITEYDRKEILSMFYYFGYGVNENKSRAVKYFFENLVENNEQVFMNKVPEEYGTERRTTAYMLCEEILRAGIELERTGRDERSRVTSEEERTISLAMAKKYYIAALTECPRAAVYLLRFMLDNKDPDFLPFAALITTYWVPNCEDTKKAINMAYYMLGLYYEYFYTEFQDNSKYSDFIMKSNLIENGKWIANYKTDSQDIIKAMECYSKAARIDDASRRALMLKEYV